MLWIAYFPLKRSREMLLHTRIEHKVALVLDDVNNYLAAKKRGLYLGT